MDWILHLDTDELIHPAGGREYSLRQLLLDVPGNVDMVIFPNYVSDILILGHCLSIMYIETFNHVLSTSFPLLSRIWFGIWMKPIFVSLCRRVVLNEMMSRILLVRYISLLSCLFSLFSG